MTSRHCIATGAEITPDNDSKAHVIPSALGGRLKPSGVLCEDGNSDLNDKFDLPLTKTFVPVMAMLGGFRDRGETPPIKMTDEAGAVYDFEFGKPLGIAGPPTLETEDKDGVTHIVAKARSRKELRTILGKVRKSHPQFDIQEAVQRSVLAEAWPDGQLKFRLQLGPIALFPAAFVAANIFAVHEGFSPHPSFRSYVSSYDPENKDRPLPPDTFYFCPPRPWVCAKGEVTHVIVLAGDAARKQMLVYVEYFNIGFVATLFPYAGPGNVLVTHAIDVVAGTESAATVDEGFLRSCPWQATHQNGEQSHQNEVTLRMNRVMEIAQRRGRTARIDEMLVAAGEKAGGQPPSEAAQRELLDQLTNYLARFLKP